MKIDGFSAKPIRDQLRAEPADTLAPAAKEADEASTDLPVGAGLPWAHGGGMGPRSSQAERSAVLGAADANRAAVRERDLFHKMVDQIHEDLQGLDAVDPAAQTPSSISPMPLPEVDIEA